MALPLNVYQTLTGITSTSPQIIYTAPIGYTGVILLGQVANIGEYTEKVLFSYVKFNVSSEILPNSPIESEDVIRLFNGKLIVNSEDSLELSGTNGTSLKYIISILETLN